MSSDTAGHDRAMRDVAEILGVAAFAADRFLSTPSWELNVPGVIERLGRVTGVSRVRVFENEHDADGALWTSQRFVWSADDVLVPADAPSTEHVSLDSSTLRRWRTVLGGGQIVRGHVRDLPKGERGLLRRWGVQSILVIPIFAGDDWWGFVGFDACTAEREWGVVEIDALKTVAGTLGAAVRRRRTEDALRISEQRYRSIFTSAPVGIYRTAVDGTILLANPALAHILGYDGPDEIEGLNLGSDVYLDPAERAALIRRYEPVGGAHDLLLRWKRKDGRPTWIRLNARAIRDADGTVKHFEGFVLDENDRKHAEDEVMESEERYRSLVEHSPDAILVHDGERYVFANAAAARLLGATDPHELLGLPVLAIVAPDSQELVRERMRRAMTGDRPNPAGEMEFVRFDGSFVTVEVIGIPIALRGQRAVQIVVRDISERRRAELAVRQSEERLRVVVRATSDAVWDWDLATGAIWWGEGFQLLFGAAENDATPDYDAWARRLHDDDRDRVVNGIEAVIASGKHEWQDEYRFLRADGTYAHVLDRGHVLHDGTGRPIRMIGAMVDISDRKRAEEALRQAQKIEAVGQLTGGIAHDFNNLLTVILANADLINADLPPSSSVAGELRDLQQAARRGQAMVKKLLGFARKTTLELRHVDLGALVRDVCDVLRRVLPANIDLRHVPSGKVSPVLADPGAIEQILLNLGTNARDAMPDGGVLRIETFPLQVEESSTHPTGAPAGNFACVVVADTGMGMTDEVQARLFEPFFTTKAVGRGTGLGMAMVYGLVKQHNGYIQIDSTAGRGTLIKILLPATDANVGGDVERRPSTAALPVGHETILIVEDEESLRAVARRILERLGYQVLVAADGQEALDVFRAERDRIELVFSDLIMPRMGGLELYDVVRREGGTVPFLFASGYTTEDFRDTLGVGPSAPLLHKPWTAIDVAQRVREVLDAGADVNAET